MDAMTSRERLTAALRQQPVDRLPWTADITYYNFAMREQGRLDAKYDGIEGYLLQHEELGVDPYFDYDEFYPFDIIHDGVTIETQRRGRDEITTYTLGTQSLHAVNRYVPEGFSWAPFKHAVETTADLAVLLEILRRTRIVPQMERHRGRQQRWGKRGLLSIGVPRTPIPALIAEWCGIMATTYMSMDAPDLFADVLAAFDRVQDPVYEAYAEYRPVVVHFADNISGENVGSFWDKYMAPVYRRRLKQLRDAGILCVIHNDGTVASILGKIAATGFDGAESLTPAPVGDAEVAELRTIAGRDDFILWGMVPGAMFSKSWSEEKFREHIAAVLDKCSAPFILGTADQVPPDSDILRLKIVAEMIGWTADGEV